MSNSESKRACRLDPILSELIQSKCQDTGWLECAMLCVFLFDLLSNIDQITSVAQIITYEYQGAETCDDDVLCLLDQYFRRIPKEAKNQLKRDKSRPFLINLGPPMPPSKGYKSYKLNPEESRVGRLLQLMKDAVAPISWPRGKPTGSMTPSTPACTPPTTATNSNVDLSGPSFVTPVRKPVFDPSRTPGFDPSRTPVCDPSRTPVFDPSRTPGCDPPRTPDFAPPCAPFFDTPRTPGFTGTPGFDLPHPGLVQQTTVAATMLRYEDIVSEQTHTKVPETLFVHGTRIRFIDQVFGPDHPSTTLVKHPAFESESYQRSLKQAEEDGGDLTDTLYNVISFFKLAAGGMSVIKVGWWHPEIVAVKFIKCDSQGKKNDARKEADIQRMCSHPLIIQVKDFVENKKWVEIIMELSEYCSLREILFDKRWNQRHRLIELLCLICDLLQALVVAHLRKVLHLDIKIDNFVLAKDKKNPYAPRLKLTDFGLGEIAPNGSITLNGVLKGTFSYMAPEVYAAVLDGTYLYTYTEKCDVFGAGVVIHEILSRKQVFSEIPKEERHRVAELHCSGERAQFDDDFPQVMIPVVQGCWLQDPNKRFTALEGLVATRAVLVTL
eukprot:TRINITY_DN5142_c0_g1_i6.p1 TRINITY_DN5142_c0_g1~~TRINITY_DN5142_c0_g1_i6.p1  ORF type:complete len:625 (-),score=77.64 TRINITY_DN5142_c0_g1_i6:33-1859(-)